MMRRRQMMAGKASGGTYIYRLDNAPASTTNTGIILTDTDKDWTILVEASFPKAYEDSSYYYRNGNNQTTFFRNNSSMTLNSSAVGFGVYNYYGRMYWMGQQNYTSNNSTKDFIRTDPRRYAAWHEKGTKVGKAKLNNSGIMTTPAADFAADSTPIHIRGSGSYIEIRQVLIYDKLLTENEINAYITDGTIP